MFHVFASNGPEKNYGPSRHQRIRRHPDKHERRGRRRIRHRSYTSGELYALRVQNGRPAWSDLLTRSAM